MSQTNAFAKAQNPDFVYLDLQQSNVYNNTNGEGVDVAFIETRDSPVIANTGEYHMSVTRFQIDTYNLPVLVVEPDLTQPTATYNKDQTIYKVALIPLDTTIVSQLTQLQVIQQQEFFFSTEQSDFGIHMASAPNKEHLGVVISRGYANGGNGALEFYNGLTNQFIPYTWAIPDTLGIGMSQYIVGITEDERFIITDAFRTASSTRAQTFNILVWDRQLSPNNPYVLSSNYVNRGIPQISGDGNRIVKANSGAHSLSLYNFNTNTGEFTKFGSDITTDELDGGEVIGQNGLAMNSDGSTIVITNKAYGADGNGAVIMYNIDWATPDTETAYPFTGGTSDYLGHFVCLSGDGNVVAVSAVGSSAPYINIYDKTSPAGVITWTLTQTLTGGEVELGDRLSLNADGSILFVATNTTLRIKRFSRATGSFVFDVKIAEFPAIPFINLNVNVATNSSGNLAYVTNYGFVVSSVPLEHEVLEISGVSAGDTFQLPPSIKNVPIIKPVIWRSDYIDETAPEKNELTGKNTALYQYYYCNAYENFIARVNIAIKEAYTTMIQDLYVDWVARVNNASLTNVFVDYVLRQYTPPPFLEWNEAELKAELYATLLFQTNYINQENTINYSSNPDVIYSVVGNNRVGTVGKTSPFLFQLAMNASLYSLFNSFPATKKVLTAPVTLYKETYYIMNFFTTGNDLLTPNVPLRTPPLYPFVGANYVNASGNIAYPSAYTADIAQSNFLIKQPQELSTIDTWCPINGIVFTTNTLPIVTNQYSSNSVINNDRPSFETSAQYALIITDLQTNEQGYRPNVLYNPTAEYRRIDMTGNRGLTNIDIRVFWRAKTGQLIPFKLSSGVSASIKILFQKKILGEKQQLQMAQTIKEGV
jgi:hypothetical protein